MTAPKLAAQSHSCDGAVAPPAPPKVATESHATHGGAHHHAEPISDTQTHTANGSASPSDPPIEYTDSQTSDGGSDPATSPPSVASSIQTTYGGLVSPSKPPIGKAFSHGNDGGFDPSPIIAAVAMWEDLMGTRRAIGQRVTAAAKHGVTIPELDLVHDLIDQAESLIEKRIVKEWRKHPLAPWAKSVPGLGEHSIAVLVAYLDGSAVVAHPRWWEGVGENRKLVHGEPYERTIRELWAYCGVGDPLRARRHLRDGCTADDVFACGKPLAKARLRLIAESMLKAGNRAVYDARRKATESRVHDRPCAPCKAKAGDPWKPGHQHADALRIVAKHLLADLHTAERAQAAAGSHIRHGAFPDTTAPPRAHDADERHRRDGADGADTPKEHAA